MEEIIPKFIDQMRAVERPKLLSLLAAAITELTIRGRLYYDDENQTHHLRETNEAVHRLAGHLRDLCKPDEVFTESRAAGISEQLALLHSSAIVRINEHIG